jgi:hypothetical protein
MPSWHQALPVDGGILGLEISAVPPDGCCWGLHTASATRGVSDAERNQSHSAVAAASVADKQAAMNAQREEVRSARRGAGVEKRFRARAQTHPPQQSGSNLAGRCNQRMPRKCVK